jgi:hypothetical protein
MSKLGDETMALEGVVRKAHPANRSASFISQAIIGSQSNASLLNSIKPTNEPMSLLIEQQAKATNAKQK